MTQFFQNRLQLQLCFALAAACLVAVLLVEVVGDAVRHAEGYVVAQTERALAQAISEMRREYRLRTKGDFSWQTLPEAEQNISLRALSETVLSAYPGVEGGYWGSQFLGYSFPTHDGGSPKYDVPQAERGDIAAVIAEAMRRGYAERVLLGKRDVVVIAAGRSGSEGIWAMKRLPGEAAPGERTHALLIAALVAAAFLSAAGVLATAFALRRGVAEVKAGLARLNTDLTYKLPERKDELGEIAAAVNEMAAARERLEAELRREDRLRATGRLVSRIAHEIRNPLNGIRLSLQALAARGATRPANAADFQHLMEEVDRMNRLVSDLLAFQQTRPPRLEVVDMSDVLEKSIRIVAPEARKRDIAVVRNQSGDFSEETICALADEQFAVQILVNLLLNAIDASSNGSAVSLHLQQNSGSVWVRVADRGPGLTPEQEQHLFEPFYTTKPNGHGLGLAVSRELARNMHGDLLYEPKASEGAIFVLRLRSAGNGE
jgi:signal transduction histidine kinase